MLIIFFLYFVKEFMHIYAYMHSIENHATQVRHLPYFLFFINNSFTHSKSSFLFLAISLTRISSEIDEFLAA